MTKVIPLAKVGRPCTICASPRRADIEAAVVSRVPREKAARQYNVSADAITRHVANHAAPEVLAATAPTSPLSAAGAAAVVTSVAAIAKRAEQASTDAYNSGDPVTGAKLGDAALRAAVALAARFGIEHEQTVDTIEGLATFARAAATAARSDSAFASTLADALDHADRADDAIFIRSLPESRIETT